MADKAVVFDVLARMKESGSDKLINKTKLIAAAATGLAVKFGVDSVKAYAEAEQSQNKLQNAYEKFPKLADVSLSSLQDLNSAQELKTQYDDDETAAAESVLAQYKLTGSQLQTLVPLMQDYAAKTGKDLPTAAGTLGKALLGQGKALKGVGINFKDTKTQAGNYNELVGALRQQVGGFAESEGKTAAGQAKILSNNFGEFKENVGKVIVAYGQKLLPVFTKAAVWLTNNSDLVLKLGGGVAGLAAGVYAVDKATKTWSASTKALNLVMEASPWVRIAMLVLAVGTALVVAYKHSQTFRDVVSTVFHFVKVGALDLGIAFIRYLLIPVLNSYSAIVHGAAAAFGWIPGIGGKLKAARSAFDTFRRGVDGALHGMQAELSTENAKYQLSQFLGWARSAAGSARIVAEAQLYVKDIRPGQTYSQHASGGMLTEGWNLINERGAEWLYKSGSGVQVYPHGTGGPSMATAGGLGTTVYLTMPVLYGNADQAAREVLGALERLAGKGVKFHIAKAVA